MKKIIRNICALIFLFIGFLGGFIPILQGWVFVLIGFILLDFSKKELLEAKILSLISKTKIGKKLADLWARVKDKNREALKYDGNKFSDIYKKIDKKAE